MNSYLRLQALLAAKLNEERAELCSDRPALAEFFHMNARLFRTIAFDTQRDPRSIRAVQDDVQ